MRYFWLKSKLHYFKLKYCMVLIYYNDIKCGMIMSTVVHMCLALLRVSFQPKLYDYWFLESNIGQQRATCDFQDFANIVLFSDLMIRVRVDDDLMRMRSGEEGQ